MDPLEFGKNDENGGRSKRRISSILKAPRKSAVCPDPVQQEYTMELCKPAEKRISRRVSFAPANDVLLFSKDLKNSPARSPLQELMTTAAPTLQNSRAQVDGAEEANQHIKGMETLLSAPLHHSRHPEKLTSEDLAERTTMFCDDDAFMDMTHSHTINIAHDHDTLSDGAHGSRPAGGAPFRAASTDFTPTLREAVGVNMDFCASPALPEFDSEFRDFLSSLSKPSGPGAVPAATFQVNHVSKENQAPLEVSRSVAPAHHQDSSFEKAEEEDEPFGFLFPPKELLKAQGESASEKTAQPKSQLGATRSAEVTSLRRSSTPASRLSSKSDRASGLTQNHTVHPASGPGSSTSSGLGNIRSSLSTPSTRSDTRTPAKALQAVEPSSSLNRTSAVEEVGDDDGDLSMDLTEAHAGYIFEDGVPTLDLLPQPAGGRTSVAVLTETGVCMSVSEAAPKSEPRGHTAGPTAPLLPKRSQRGGETLRGTSVKDVEMEITECLTMNVETDLLLDSLLNKDRVPNRGPGRAVRTSEETLCDQDVSMDLTMAQTGPITELEQLGDLQRSVTSAESIPRRSVGVRDAPAGRRSGAAAVLLSRGRESSVEPSRPATAEQKTSAEDRERTVRFSEDMCMDETRSHTAIIAADLESQNQVLSASVGEKAIRFNCSEAHMDLTRSHTAHLDLIPSEKTLRFTATDAEMELTRSHTTHLAAHLDLVPSEKTLRFTATDAEMELTRSHTAHLDLVPSEKTLRFSANDAAMDITRCLTTRIDVTPRKASQFGGERTVRFSADDAAMEMTRCHTASIASHLTRLSVPLVPSGGEKTVRFSAHEAEMDMTRSHTVRIHGDVATQKHRSRDLVLPGGERTIQFQAQDADMDFTQCGTVNVAACLDGDARQKLNAWRRERACDSADQTLRFQDVAMDVTKNHTVRIEAHLDTQKHSDGRVRLQSSDAAVDVTRTRAVNIAADPGAGRDELPAGGPEETLRCQDAAMDVTKNHTVKIVAHQVLPVSSEDAPLNMAAGLEPVALPGGEGTLRFSAGGAAETRDSGETPPASAVGALLGSRVDSQQHPNTLQEPATKPSQSSTDARDQVRTDELSRSRSFSAVRSHSGVRTGRARLSLTISEAATASSQETEVAPGRAAADPREMAEAHNTVEGPGPTRGSGAQPYSRVDDVKAPDQLGATLCREDGQVSPARKSGMSLADLQTKVRRLSHLISAAPTDPPVPDLDPDDTCKDTRPEAEDEDGSQAHAEEPRLSPVTPSNLNTKTLMSRLSLGSIKPKLPSRGKALDEKPSVGLVSEGGLGDLDHDVSDINDEELGSYDDVSETLDLTSPHRTSATSSPPERYSWDLDPDLDLDALADLAFAPHGTKRGSLPDKGAAEEKRMKPDEDAMPGAVHEVSPLCDLHWPLTSLQDAGSPHLDPSVATQPVDTSCSSHASSRCEGAFEATLDCTSDVPKKLEDPNITASEFLKLFNIDFVIHKPRQSVPGKQTCSEDSTEMQLLRGRHVLLPRQRVYERENQRLAERVEELKVRKEDLDRPLRIMNWRLWKEMKTLSEPELKGFGVKLKERHRFFSRLSKEMFHEKKEALYLELLRAHEEEDVEVWRAIDEAEEVLGGLDECIAQVQAEVTALEEPPLGQPSLTCLQEELRSLEQTLEQNSRRARELETSGGLHSSKMERLKVETKTLQSQADLLHLLSEWRVDEQTGSRTLFSFLHGTLRLEVAHQHGEQEEKLTGIDFTLQLDDERSQDHARLVHLLVSQHLQAQASWLDRYPTRGHVPKLLADVGLVVGRCRLLGEEVRLLRMWGGLRLDVLDISCRDGRVQILFSSLERFSKFEVVLSASVVDRVCVLQLFSFRNLIGHTRLSQVSEIVASVSPGRQLLTRIVKKIHRDLLS